MTGNRRRRHRFTVLVHRERLEDLVVTRLVHARVEDSALPSANTPSAEVRPRRSMSDEMPSLAIDEPGAQHPDVFGAQRP